MGAHVVRPCLLHFVERIVLLVTFVGIRIELELSEQVTVVRNLENLALCYHYMSQTSFY